jgi:preprotein translocase subunit SecD
VRLANAPDGTKVRARWVAVKAEGTAENQKLVDTDIATHSSQNVIDFTIKPPPAGLAAGDYRVDIYLNPAADKEGQPAKSLPFSVKSSGPQITTAVLSSSPEGSPQVTSFPTDAEKLYCLVEFRGARVGTRMAARWFVMEAEGETINQEMASADLVIDDLKQNVATFSFAPSRRGLPPGRYRVDLHIDNSGAPAKTLAFTIE